MKNRSGVKRDTPRVCFGDSAFPRSFRIVGQTVFGYESCLNVVYLQSKAAAWHRILHYLCTHRVHQASASVGSLGNATASGLERQKVTRIIRKTPFKKRKR